MVKRILIIDDEPELVKAAAVRLKAGGYEVEVTCDGLSGINKTKEIQPNLILLDIIMSKKELGIAGFIQKGTEFENVSNLARAAMRGQK